MNITDYIVECLQKGKCVEIPGIGTLKPEIEESHFDQTNSTYYPTRMKVNFDSRCTGNSELANYIAEQECVNTDIAKSMLKNYVDALEERLGSTGSHTIPGVGTIKKGDSGMAFEAAAATNMGNDTNPLAGVKTYQKGPASDPFAAFEQPLKPIEQPKPEVAAEPEPVAVEPEPVAEEAAATEPEEAPAPAEEKAEEPQAEPETVEMTRKEAKAAEKKLKKEKKEQEKAAREAAIKAQDEANKEKNAAKEAKKAAEKAEKEAKEAAKKAEKEAKKEAKQAKKEAKKAAKAEEAEATTAAPAEISENMNKTEKKAKGEGKKKGKAWLWILIAVLVLLLGGAAAVMFYQPAHDFFFNNVLKQKQTEKTEDIEVEDLITNNVNENAEAATAETDTEEAAPAPANMPTAAGDLFADANIFTLNEDLVAFTPEEIEEYADQINEFLSGYISQYLASKRYTSAKVPMMDRIKQYATDRLTQLLSNEGYSVQRFLPYNDYVADYLYGYKKNHKSSQKKVVVQTEIMSRAFLDNMLTKTVEELGLKADNAVVKMPETKPAPEVKCESKSRLGFDLIAGFYTNKATADKMAQRLKGYGCNAYIIEINHGYYVSMGSAKNRTQADAMLHSAKEWYDGDLSVKSW